MLIPILQFLLPNGRRREICGEISDDLGGQWEQIRTRGLRITAEILMTDEVSLALEDPARGDFDSRIITNGPAVPKALDDLVRSFRISLFDAWRTDWENKN